MIFKHRVHQAVSNYAGTYIVEFNELRSHLDDGCEVLQQVLDNDVPGPQVKLNVGQLEAQKRKEIVEVAAQMADQWAKEDRKEAARLKADEALSNLLDGNFAMLIYMINPLPECVCLFVHPSRISETP